MSDDSSRSGIVAIVVLVAGWLVSALWIVPRIRDFMAIKVAAGIAPDISHVWSLPMPVRAAMVAVPVLFAAGVALLVLWIRGCGGLGRLVEERLRHPGRLAAAVAIWTALVSVAVLADGMPTILDTKTHIARSWIWGESLRSGSLPVWTDLWYGGFLIDQFYPPLSHLVVAIVALPGISTPLAAKLVVWLASIFGSAGFALWCRSFHRSTQSGLLGGVLYSIIPTINSAWMWQGRFPSAVLMGVLPWAFLAVHRLANRAGGRRAAAGLALCLAAIVFSHTLQARIALTMLAAYSITEFTFRRGARLGWLLVGWGGGLILSLCLLVPMYLERHFVNDIVPPKTVFFSIAPHIGAVFKHAFSWSARDPWYPGITVLSLMVLGIWSLARSVRRGDRSRRDAWSAFAVIVAPWAIATIQPGNVEFLFFGAAMLAAAGIAHVRGWKRSHVLLPVILLLLVDLGPSRLISTYVTRRGDKEEIYETLEASRDTGNYLELPLGPDGSPRSSYWHYALTQSVPCVAGPFIQGAPKSFVYRASLIDTIAAAFAAGSYLSDPMIEYLAFENIGMVGVSSPTTINPPQLAVPPGIELDPGFPVWRVVDASPVSVIDSLPDSPLPERPRVSSLGIGSDTPHDRSASRTVLSAVFSWMESAKPVPVEGVGLHRRPNAVDLRVPDVGERTIRVALAAYPTMAVHVDGEPVAWREGPLGGIMIDVVPGSHRISIQGKITGTRSALGILLGVLAAGIAVMGITPGKTG